jgi:hypothetical protein
MPLHHQGRPCQATPAHPRRVWGLGRGPDTGRAASTPQPGWRASQVEVEVEVEVQAQAQEGTVDALPLVVSAVPCLCRMPTHVHSIWGHALTICSPVSCMVTGDTRNTLPLALCRHASLSPPPPPFPLKYPSLSVGQPWLFLPCPHDSALCLFCASLHCRSTVSCPWW